MPGGSRIGSNLPFPLTLVGIKPPDAQRLAKAVQTRKYDEFAERLMLLIASMAARNCSRTAVSLPRPACDMVVCESGSLPIASLQRVIDALPNRASFTRDAIQSLTSDSSQPTARGPS